MVCAAMTQTIHALMFPPPGPDSIVSVSRATSQGQRHAVAAIRGVIAAGDPAFLRKVAIGIVPHFVATSTVAVLIDAAIATWMVTSNPQAIPSVSPLNSPENAVGVEQRIPHLIPRA